MTRNLGKNTKLTRRVSEKTNLSLAVLTVLASFSSITRRVKPALKNTMSKLTGISAVASAASKLRTNFTGVVILPRVSPASLFTRMGKRAVSPVMTTATSAAANLKLIHPEMIRRVRIQIPISHLAISMSMSMSIIMIMITINGVIKRQELLEI